MSYFRSDYFLLEENNIKNVIYYTSSIVVIHSTPNLDTTCITTGVLLLQSVSIDRAGEYIHTHLHQYYYIFLPI